MFANEDKTELVCSVLLCERGRNVCKSGVKLRNCIKILLKIWWIQIFVVSLQRISDSSNYGNQQCVHTT